jgi:hypothetical protein
MFPRDALVASSRIKMPNKTVTVFFDMWTIKGGPQHHPEILGINYPVMQQHILEEWTLQILCLLSFMTLTYCCLQLFTELEV